MPMEYLSHSRKQMFIFISRPFSILKALLKETDKEMYRNLIHPAANRALEEAG